MTIGDPMPAALVHAPLLDADGREARVGALLDGRPLLLVFLRHFGCIACAEQVHDMLPRLDELAALGVRVVLVGNGPPAHLGAFVERHDLADKRVEVLTDPSLAAFEEAGLARSAWATWGPRATLDFVRALGHGHRPRRTDGDLDQQGGAVLVDPSRRVAWLHRNRSLGDHANPSDIVDAALRLRLLRTPLPV
jgi:peroxiredoxin